MGINETSIFYYVVFGVGIFLTTVLLGMFKLRSWAISLAAGYLCVLGFALAMGFDISDPLIKYGGEKSALLDLSYPSTMLLRVKHVTVIMTLAAATIQYALLGWTLQLTYDGIFSHIFTR